MHFLAIIFKKVSVLEKKQVPQKEAPEKKESVD